MVWSADGRQTDPPDNEPEALAENGVLGSTGRDDWKDMWPSYIFVSPRIGRSAGPAVASPQDEAS
ncbi:MAG: hypothetical protein AMJ92_06000 [candidate division Zixibacteria bacterium SM23_81]|nr:MAG: hypothetical protein AMJ92_06000 [candidate division Zixibacteria bacterium SM23_81]